MIPERPDLLKEQDRFSVGFAGVLALDLRLALAIGYGVGKLLEALLATRLSKPVKTVAVVAIGYGIFLLAGQVKAYSAANLPFEIYIEPLLIALVGGFLVTNFTTYRNQFDELLHDVGPAIYVAFFTLTGISLKLDILLAVLPAALVLFGVRAAGVFLGSFTGGAMAGTPARFRRISWMAFITQAGIALGLAREVAVQFPSLGDAFATLIINEKRAVLSTKPVRLRSGQAPRAERSPPLQVAQTGKILRPGVARDDMF